LLWVGLCCYWFFCYWWLVRYLADRVARRQQQRGRHHLREHARERHLQHRSGDDKPQDGCKEARAAGWGSCRELSGLFLGEIGLFYGGCRALLHTCSLRCPPTAAHMREMWGSTTSGTAAPSPPSTARSRSAHPWSRRTACAAHFDVTPCRALFLIVGVCAASRATVEQAHCLRHTLMYAL